MSIDAIEAVLTHSKARGADRLVLLAVAWHLNHEHPERSAWPSVGRIAEMANVSIRQVKTSLRRLEECGELEVQRRHGPHRVNFYRLGGALTQGKEGDPARVALGEDTSPKDADQKPNATDGAQNAQNDALSKPALGEDCARGVKSVHVALGEDTSPKPVEPEINTTGGMAQEINGAFPAPGAEGDCVAPAPLPPAKALSFENTTPKGETTMTERPCTEGERPKSWAAALRFLLDLTDVPERDFRRSGPIATVARRWVDGEISEAEARKLAAEIARRVAA